MNIGRAWIVSTIILGLSLGTLKYAGSSSSNLVSYLVVWSLAAIVVNAVFWFPMLKCLGKRNLINLWSSIVSSALSGLLGVVTLFVILAIGLYREQEELLGSVKHSSSLSFDISDLSVLLMLVLIPWGVSGLLFWIQLSKQSTNKEMLPTQKDARQI
jgi:hypothetical protein